MEDSPDPPRKKLRREISAICPVKSCKTTSLTAGASLFRFPKDSERCKGWLRLCRCEYLGHSVQNLYTSMYRVCHLHFTQDMFKKWGEGQKKRLIDNSLPNQNLPSDESTPVEIPVNLDSGVEVLPTLPINVPLTIETDFNIIESEAGPSTSSTQTLSQKLKSPEIGTQTPKLFTRSTPRKQKLRSKVHALQTSVRGLKRKLVVQEDSPNFLEKVTLTDFKNLCDKFLEPKCAAFVKVQADLHQKTPHQRRYTKEFLNMCLKIYFMGPRSYQNLGRIFTLPTKRTLNKLTEDLNLQPGINKSLFEALKEKVSTFVDIDKNCCICLDEMAIKTHLFYNIGKDEVVGLEDLGHGKTLKPALHALVIMVKGIYHNWKQPIAYYFSHNTCPAINLKEIIKECITSLKKIDLTVRVLVNDMGSSNISVAQQLGISENNQTFSVNGLDVVYLFDSPHIIKAIRNNLIKHTFVFNGKKTSWDFVKKFYESDKNLQNRLAPKLTDSHIYPSNLEKMKVHLATQVLSQTVTAGMTTYMALGHLPAEAIGTIEVIEKFDKIFDILNSSRTSNAKDFNRAFKGLEYQVNFLQETMLFLDKVRVINKKNEDVTNKIKALKCLKITIRGLLCLWETLNSLGFEYIFTRRLCQDSLENYFGWVRKQSGNAVNPTPIQFQRAFKKLITQEFFFCENQNCLPDLEEILKLNLEGHARFGEESEPKKKPTGNLKDCDYHFHDIEQNSIRYTCGYLIRKCLSIHTCDVCIEYSNEYQNFDETTYYAHFRAYETKNKELFGKLHMPSENFFQYICELEVIFKDNFQSVVLQSDTLHKFQELYKCALLKHPCDNFPYTYLVELYSRMRLFYCLKFVNANFKTTNSKGEKINRKKIIWQHN